MQEKGLGVVPGVVGGDHQVAALGLRRSKKKGVAKGPGGLLYGAFLLPGKGPDVPLAYGEGNAPFPAQVPDELFVPVGFGLPKKMIKVRGPKGEVLLPGEPVEKADRIRSPGHGAEDAASLDRKSVV